MRMQPIARLTLTLLLVSGVAQASDRSPRRQLDGRDALRQELFSQLETVESSLPPATVALLAWQVSRADSDQMIADVGQQLDLLTSIVAESPSAEEASEARLEHEVGRLGYEFGGTVNLRSQTEGLSSKKPRKFKLRRGAFLPSPNGF